MIPTSTPIPFDFEPAVKAEFVSWSLLIFQLFVVGCVIFTLVYLYARLNQWLSDEPSDDELKMFEKEREISDLRVQLHNAMTGSMQSSLDDDDEYPVDDEPEEIEDDNDSDYLRCTYCGTSNELDARACVSCGAPRKKAFA